MSKFDKGVLHDGGTKTSNEGPARNILRSIGTDFIKKQKVDGYSVYIRERERGKKYTQPLRLGVKTSRRKGPSCDSSTVSTAYSWVRENAHNAINRWNARIWAKSSYAGFPRGQLFVCRVFAPLLRFGASPSLTLNTPEYSVLTQFPTTSTRQQSPLCSRKEQVPRIGILLLLSTICFVRQRNAPRLRRAQ